MGELEHLIREAEQYGGPPYGSNADWDELRTGISVEQALINKSVQRFGSTPVRLEIVRTGEPMQVSGDTMEFRHPPKGSNADWDELRTGISVEQELIKKSLKSFGQT